MTDRTPETLSEEEKAVKLKKAKAKIRTIRIWGWIIMALLLGSFFLSQCALSKPKAKMQIIESCVKNVPFSEKWHADLKAQGLDDKAGEIIEPYCTCVWNEPLEKLSEKQIRSLSKLNAHEQLELLGGAAAFEARDKQCIAGLKAH